MTLGSLQRGSESRARDSNHNQRRPTSPEGSNLADAVPRRAGADRPLEQGQCVAVGRVREVHTTDKACPASHHLPGRCARRRQRPARLAAGRGRRRSGGSRTLPQASRRAMHSPSRSTRRPRASTWSSRISPCRRDGGLRELPRCIIRTWIALRILVSDGSVAAESPRRSTPRTSEFIERVCRDTRSARKVNASPACASRSRRDERDYITLVHDSCKARLLVL